MTQIEKIVENDWEPTANRFVAFFDIMGFKDLVLKSKHDEIVILLNKLSAAREELHDFNSVIVDSNSIKGGETKSFTFSDSIIFFSKGNNKHDASKIILDCVYLLKIALENNIPIKGALSYGEVTVDLKNSIYFGKPIIDAFLLHEDLHLFSVIADHSFQKKVTELNNGKMHGKFKLYKTPLKTGKVNHYILMPISGKNEQTIKNLEKLYLEVSGKPRQYIDNTIDFINSLESQKNK
ncbi:MAG TPA: hypothetical protein PKZ75_10445 [Bacteroidia bacterium]|nr:hypothetical protein [Bacteroidia bacterium]